MTTLTPICIEIVVCICFLAHIAYKSRAGWHPGDFGAIVSTYVSFFLVVRSVNQLVNKSISQLALSADPLLHLLLHLFNTHSCIHSHHPPPPPLFSSLLLLLLLLFFSSLLLSSPPLLLPPSPPLSYLVLPSVSTTIFGSFNCVSVDPEHLVPGLPKYLRLDYSISCDSPRWVFPPSLLRPWFFFPIVLRFFIPFIVSLSLHSFDKQVMRIYPHLIS